jgi:PAS domain-containing protein
VHDALGRIVGASKIARDITERKRAEEGLRRSEDRLATMLKYLPVGVGIVDTAGHVVIANPMLRRFIRGDIPAIDESEDRNWRVFHPNGRPLERANYFLAQKAVFKKNIIQSRVGLVRRHAKRPTGITGGPWIGIGGSQSLINGSKDWF